MTKLKVIQAIEALHPGAIVVDFHTTPAVPLTPELDDQLMVAVVNAGPPVTRLEGLGE